MGRAPAPAAEPPTRRVERHPCETTGKRRLTSPTAARASHSIANLRASVAGAGSPLPVEGYQREQQ